MRDRSSMRPPSITAQCHTHEPQSFGGMQRQRLTARTSYVVPPPLDRQLQRQFKRERHSATHVVFAARDNNDRGRAIDEPIPRSAVLAPQGGARVLCYHDMIKQLTGAAVERRQQAAQDQFYAQGQTFAFFAHTFCLEHLLRLQLHHLPRAAPRICESIHVMGSWSGVVGVGG